MQIRQEITAGSMTWRGTPPNSWFGRLRLHLPMASRSSLHICTLVSIHGGQTLNVHHLFHNDRHHHPSWQGSAFYWGSQRDLRMRPPQSTFEWKKCSVIDNKDKLLAWYANNPSEYGNLWAPTLTDGTRVELHVPLMIALPLKAASLYHQFN